MLAAPLIAHVAAPGLNMRSLPGADQAALPTPPLAQGDPVTVLGVAISPDGGRWAYVQSSSSVYGYVNAKYLTETIPSPAAAAPAATPEPQAAADAPPSASAPPPPAEAAASTDASESARTTRDRTLAYFASWSQADNTGLTDVAQDYADNVVFYGVPRTRQEVMAEKTRFAVRWPMRRYTVRADSLSASCTDAHFCSAQGVLDWSAGSSIRDAASVGVAQFSFSFQDGLIVAEGGRVLSRS
jgi:hypothetical protein